MISLHAAIVTLLFSSKTKTKDPLPLLSLPIVSFRLFRRLTLTLHIAYEPSHLIPSPKPLSNERTVLCFSFAETRLGENPRCTRMPLVANRLWDMVCSLLAPDPNVCADKSSGSRRIRCCCFEVISSKQEYSILHRLVIYDRRAYIAKI